MGHFEKNYIMLKISDYCFRATSSESDLCVENITDWRGSGRFSNQYINISLSDRLLHCVSYTVLIRLA